MMSENDLNNEEQAVEGLAEETAPGAAPESAPEGSATPEASPAAETAPASRSEAKMAGVAEVRSLEASAKIRSQAFASKTGQS